MRVRIPPRAPLLDRPAHAALSPSAAHDVVAGSNPWHAPTIRPMRRTLVLFVAFLAFMRWRHERFEAWDAAHGYGAYAPVRPES